MIVHHALIKGMIVYPLSKEWLFTTYSRNDCLPFIEGIIVYPLLKEYLFTTY